jgi:hypothetical protein
MLTEHLSEHTQIKTVKVVRDSKGGVCAFVQCEVKCSLTPISWANSHICVAGCGFCYLPHRNIVFQSTEAVFGTNSAVRTRPCFSYTDSIVSVRLWGSVNQNLIYFVSNFASSPTHLIQPAIYPAEFGKTQENECELPYAMRLWKHGKSRSVSTND